MRWEGGQRVGRAPDNNQPLRLLLSTASPWDTWQAPSGRTMYLTLEKTVGNEKDVRLFIRRLYLSASFSASLFPASFSGVFISSASFSGVFICRRLYFSESLFFGLGVFGCLWRPAAAPHNRISIKNYQKRALASEPARLSVFLAACRFFVFVPLLFGVYISGVFFRRLYSCGVLISAP